MRSDTSKRCISLLMILIFLFANISFVYAQTCMTRNAATGEILSRLRADPLVWGLVLQEYDSDSDGTLNTQELGNLQAAVMGRVDAVIVNRNYEELVEDSGLVGKITSEDADVITRAEVQSIAFSRSPSAPIKLDLGRLENSLLSETEVQSRFGLSPTEIANHDGVKLGGRIGDATAISIGPEAFVRKKQSIFDGSFGDVKGALFSTLVINHLKSMGLVDYVEVPTAVVFTEPSTQTDYLLSNFLLIETDGTRYASLSLDKKIDLAFVSLVTGIGDLHAENVQFNPNLNDPSMYLIDLASQDTSSSDYYLQRGSYINSPDDRFAFHFKRGVIPYLSQTDPAENMYIFDGVSEKLSEIDLEDLLNQIGRKMDESGFTEDEKKIYRDNLATNLVRGFSTMLHQVGAANSIIAEGSKGTARAPQVDIDRIEQEAIKAGGRPPVPSEQEIRDHVAELPDGTVYIDAILSEQVADAAGIEEEDLAEEIEDMTPENDNCRVSFSVPCGPNAGGQVSEASVEDAVLKIAQQAPKTTSIATSANGQTVLISQSTLDHISMSHSEPGSGSIFARVPSVEELQEALNQIDLSQPAANGLYEVTITGIGYDLITRIGTASRLEGAEATTATKQERGQDISVPAYTTTQPLSDFSTDTMTLVIRPTPPEFLPADMSGDPEIVQKAEQGQIFSILSSWPGRATIDGQEIPPASQWEGRFAVVIPEMPEAPSSEQVEPIGSQLSEEEIRLADSIRQSLASSQTRTFLGQKGIMIVEDERGNMNLNFMGRLYPISFASPTHAKSRYYFQVADLDGMRISLFVGDKTDPEDIKPDNIFLEVSPIEPKKPDPSRTHSQEEVELKKKEIESILGNYPLIEEFFLILKAQMADPEAYHSAILQVIQDKKGKSDKNTEKSVDQLVDSLVDRFEISHELRSRVKDYVKQMSEMIMPVVSRLPHTRTMIKDSGEGGLLDIVLSEGHTPMFYRSAETGFSTKDELWAGTEHVHVNLGSPGDFMYGNIVFIFSPQGLQESEDSFYLPRDENYGFYTSYGMPTLSLEEKISAAMDQDDAKRLLAASIVYNHLKTNLDSGLDITYLVQNSMHFNQIISVLQGMSSNSVVGKIEGHIPNSIPLSDQIIMAPVTDREWITRSLEACTGCQGLQVYFMEGSDWESYSQGRLEAYLFSVGLTELPIRETTEVSGATVKVIEGGTLEDYKTMYEKKAKSAATKSQPSIQRLYTSSGMTQTQRRNFRKTMIDSLAEKHGINIPGKAQGQVLSIIDEDLVAGRADLDIARIKQVLLKDTKLTEVSIKIATDYLSERYGDLPQSEAGKKLYGVEEVDRDFVPILETAVLQDRVDTIDDLVNELGSYVDAEMTRVGPSRKESVRSEGPVVEVSAKRLVSIGDLHASTANLRKTLVDRGIMDESGNWIAEPGTVLLQIGDLIDGGSDTSGIQSAEAIKLLKDLESQAREKDGAVVVLMGNHEVDFLAVPGGMWHYPVGRKWRRVDMLKAFGFTGDIGFVQEGKKTVFDEGTGEIPKLIRALASNDQRALQELREINPQAMQYIDWLLTRPMIAKVNVEGGPSLAFVHGGPTAEFMKELQDLRQSKGSISINDVNELLARRLSEGLNTPYFTTDSTTILAADKSDKAAGGQARFPDFLLDPGLLTSFLDILGADLLAGGHNPFYGLGNVEPSDSILPGIANQITSVNRIGLNSQFIKLDVDQKRERQGEDVDVQETASMISHFYIDSDMMSEVSQSGDRTLLSDGESPSDISAEQSRLFRDKMRSEVRILDFTRFRQIAGALGLQYSDEELISAFRVYEEHLLQNGLIDSRESILDMHIGVQAEKAKVC